MAGPVDRGAVVAASERPLARERPLDWRAVTGVLAVFVAASLIMTYPVPLKWLHEVAGPPEDNLQGLWNLWWVKKAILQYHQSPLHTDLLYYPQGVDLSFHTLSYFNTLLGVPLQSIFGLVGTYNLLWFLSFPFGALGAFLLCHDLTKNRRAAFLAGWAFSFSAYHMAHATHHLNLNSIQFIPFYVWSLRRMETSPKMSHGALAGLFFVGASLCSWYHGVFLGIFTLIWLIAQRRQIPKSAHGPILLAAGIGLLGLLPFTYPMLRRLLTEPAGVFRELAPGHLGGDLLGYVIPGPLPVLFEGLGPS